LDVTQTRNDSVVDSEHEFNGVFGSFLDDNSCTKQGDGKSSISLELEYST
jgi:hypothetical protein